MPQGTVSDGSILGGYSVTPSREGENLEVLLLRIVRCSGSRREDNHCYGKGKKGEIIERISAVPKPIRRKGRGSRSVAAQG